MTLNYVILHRKSFFSGHASFSMYTMLYLAVSNYLSCMHTYHRNNGSQMIG